MAIKDIAKRIDVSVRTVYRDLNAIEGVVPSATAWPDGCRFAPRCPFADARCRRETPPAVRIGDGHVSRCWKAPLEQLAA